MRAARVAHSRRKQALMGTCGVVGRWRRSKSPEWSVAWSPHMPTEGICGPPGLLLEEDRSTFVDEWFFGWGEHAGHTQAQRQGRNGPPGESWVSGEGQNLRSGALPCPHICQQRAYVGHLGCCWRKIDRHLSMNGFSDGENTRATLKPKDRAGMGHLGSHG